MLSKSHMHKTADAVFEAQNALSGRISYDEDIAELMHAGVCTEKQAHRKLESMQADLAGAQSEYDAGKADAIQSNNMLIQEMHHRIKNSLQLVQSLLSLQARQTKNKAAAEQLYNSASRVHVIGAMHDHLYHTEAAFEVDMKPYLQGLINDLGSGILSEALGREITLDAQSVMWVPTESLSLGLILTELVTNALKYGAGVINVFSVRKTIDERC